jgi:hypothetical protein
MPTAKTPRRQITRTARQGFGLGIWFVCLGIWLAYRGFSRLPDARSHISDLVASAILPALGSFYLANAIALRRRER